MDSHAVWLAIGFLGQALFSMRFLVQWLKSEKKGRSVIPIEFWYLSIAGGGILFIYALHTADPVFIFGQVGGLFIYARNLHLIRRSEGKRPAVEPTDP
ncbi:MAG: lipid-A-disaccharide synthase N-terminal domain-containing protein [Nitrospirae bacterium]|nr:lipid-A-disaccharide synthase N-terminal domain-containing protein [Candidatus Manganitrophaceae bacterium]